MIRVLGIDPGTAATGYGIVEGSHGAYRLVECGVVRTGRDESLSVRLAAIHEGVLGVIDRHAPDCLAIEGVFYRKNARTAVILAHSRGVAMLAGALRGLPVAEYPPAEIKNSVVGTGRASKDQVGYMVCKLLSLAEAPRPADAADGCAVALCHLLTGTGRVADRRAVG
jgi:crossover junction endodeoxyribonuclease RuvC